MNKLHLQQYLRAVLILPPVIYILSMLGYWIGVPITSAHVFLSVVVVAFVAASLPIRSYFRCPLLTLRIGLFLLLYGTIIISIQTWFFDFSWDGRQYHAEAIAQLKLGWNPVYERLLPDQWGYGDPSVWLNVLPKFTWVIGASVYEITNKITSTKILGLYYLAPTIFYLYIVLSRNFGKLFTLIVSFLITLNPVVLTQVFTNYIDGPAYLILVVFFLSLIDIHQVSESKIASPWFTLLFAISALAVKFTNIIPVFVMLMMGLFISKELRISLIRARFILFAFGVIAIGLVNPYVTNLFVYGNTVYPIYKTPFTKSIDFPLNVAPDGIKKLIYDSNHNYLASQSPIKALFQSIFSYSANDNGVVQLKFPLVVQKSEWVQFGNPDVRVGGFGPFYSAGVVLGVFGVVCALLFRQMNRGRNILALGALLLIGIAVITPNSWWARYVPYLWAVPILFAIITVERLPRKLKYIPWLIIVILSINVIGVSVVVLAKNYRDTQYSKGTYWVSLKESSLKLPVPIDCAFNRDLIDFREAGIPFYCTKISRAIFKTYANHYPGNESLEGLYELKLNDAENILNGSHMESFLFFGEVLTLKSNILPRDAEQLVNFYSYPLRYSRQLFPLFNHSLFLSRGPAK